ncbi:3-phosphoserine/phosphohydroxythreonine transaminase [Bacillus methanolicus]|uniref:Phosphoserine aminotransferase n=1 Tax=Bacillus methanolicus (strain MGA3 / ATCC 53907) TaxID=796606 RepID=I3E7F7_BACMM|nr:3-phosphoserine/phosphohydroxythreonine transaminase [Bacillus methanolicus]AIE59255.1 Phosphoserine aminotransferase [Bacillus methanolicus MGA3]EIJ82428.1 phosphoserine aminotransferase [Bacillus methanolicus MGA3]
MNRAFNFNAGPAALPEAVLQKAAKECFNYNGTGMSVMELSHRSKDYEEIHFEAVSLLRKLLQIPDDYEVLLLQGGASLQFSMVPMNLLKRKKTGYYVLTGSWSEKALKEAKKIGQTSILASGKENNYKSIPDLSGIQVQNDAAYVHITSNETIHGTQWHKFPKHLSAPLVADMSSDILSKPINVQDFGLIYAGAQKNLGPSGLTVVIIKKELLSLSEDELPTMLNYRTHAENNSLYNTPPTLAIYLFKLVLEWVDSIGGIEKISKLNQEKAKILYDVIDNSDGFYIGHADPDSRSHMNVTFRLKSEETTAAFLTQAKENGFIGLNGHRSIGGCRASIYNAVPLEHVIKLADFMKSFKSQY